MSVVRIRVECKNLPANASRDEKERAFKIMFATFKRHVNESGILTRYKEVQYFESKGEKRRRKKRASDNLRRKETNKLKTRLREHFG
jgi:ribosomal protein S21